jgi:hypothetical protein
VYKKNTHKITIGMTLFVYVLGTIGVYLLIEISSFRYILAIVFSGIVGAIMYIPQRFSAQLAHEYKPWRRMFVSIMTLGLSAMLITFYGFDMFFQFPAIGWYAFGAAILSSITGYAVFRLYFTVHTRRIFVWTVMLAVLSFQLFLTISYLPLGYLWLGLVYMWLWYIAITIIRFHLSPKGIIWNKQRYFLTGSAISFFLLLLLAQWV